VLSPRQESRRRRPDDRLALRIERVPHPSRVLCDRVGILPLIPGSPIPLLLHPGYPSYSQKSLSVRRDKSHRMRVLPFIELIPITTRENGDSNHICTKG
jgi:hypothetical protein